MATAFVQSKANHSTGATATTIAVTLTSNAAAGNLFAVHTACGATTVVITVADSLGNTFTQVDSHSADGGDTQTNFYAKNIAGGADTITATFDRAVGYREIIVHEISGADTTAPLDVNAMNFQTSPGTGTDAVTSGSVTTTVNGDYIFGAVRIHNTVTLTLSAGTNYTSRENFGGGADEAPFGSEDRVQATSGAISVTFTISSNQQTTTEIMAFKPAAAAGSVVTPRLLALLGVGA